ncbi:hypothetical protein QQM39_41495 [Streptomyces sp. DT2A-34]|uniref:hypothetical protein n=1 Tax=Streptomyces sp. DT2A-34 TaxID=3051182 RepID=UPI00265B9B1C|nr:hypothetical protein [Streptomyces sp. DT2A-34]MDO0917047.1 hypothetical protein [Streptomyces sp. DT2A-34]
MHRRHPAHRPRRSYWTHLHRLSVFDLRDVLGDLPHDAKRAHVHHVHHGTTAPRHVDSDALGRLIRRDGGPSHFER